MRKLTSIVALVILLPSLAHSQTKYKIVVLGSSTAYGEGASVPDSSWVNRTKAYYKSLDQLDTLYNLAVGGTLSDDGVSKISTALAYNPDIVFVGYPSNDIVSSLGVPHLTANLRTIYNAVTSAGKKCYVTTTQPRTDPFAEPVLRVGRDSILMEFPGHALNFYDPLVMPTSDDPNPDYVALGVHPNDAGHRLLFQVVQAANIIAIAPLPLTLTGFSGSRTELGVVLSWAASNTDGHIEFFIERSTAGTPFVTIYKTDAITDGTVRHYAFTDQNPPPGRSLYRIRTGTDGNAVTYSQILSFEILSTKLAIQKLFITGGRRGITATIDIPKDGTFRLAIFNTAGIPIKQQSYSGRAPAITLDVPLPSLPSGVYFLQIATPDGQRTIKPFAVLQ